MNIVVPIKVLADDQDIVVAADRSLDDSKAHRIVSTYDLNAIEAAVQLTYFILTVLCLTLLFHKLPVNRHLQSIFLAFGGRTINFEYLYIRTLFHLHQLCQLIVFFGFGDRKSVV